MLVLQTHHRLLPRSSASISEIASDIIADIREIVLTHLVLRQEDLTHPALRDVLHASPSKEVLSSSERDTQAGSVRVIQHLCDKSCQQPNKAQLDFISKCKPDKPKPHPEYEILRDSRKKLKLSVWPTKSLLLVKEIKI